MLKSNDDESPPCRVPHFTGMVLPRTLFQRILIFMFEYQKYRRHQIGVGIAVDILSNSTGCGKLSNAPWASRLHMNRGEPADTQ